MVFEHPVSLRGPVKFSLQLLFKNIKINAQRLSIYHFLSFLNTVSQYTIDVRW